MNEMFNQRDILFNQTDYGHVFLIILRLFGLDAFITTKIIYVILARNRELPDEDVCNVETCRSELYIHLCNNIIHIISYHCAFVG